MNRLFGIILALLFTVQSFGLAHALEEPAEFHDAQCRFCILGHTHEDSEAELAKSCIMAAQGEYTQQDANPDLDHLAIRQIAFSNPDMRPALTANNPYSARAPPVLRSSYSHSRTSRAPPNPINR